MTPPPRLTSLLLMLLASTGAAAASQVETLRIDGQTRQYRLFTPSAWAPGETRSLVIALHGGGSSARALETYSGLSDKAAQAGFMVAYPDGSAVLGRLRTWNAGTCCGYAQKKNVDDVGFLSALIDSLVRRHGVDSRRVYVAGISNGGMMAYRLAAERPGQIAAVASVAGTLAIPPEQVRTTVPMLHFHGTADRFVPYDGGRGDRTLADVEHSSVDATMNAWIRANQAGDRAQVRELPDSADDGTRVWRIRHASPRDPGAVTLYRIEGGGHTWPGRAGHERLLGPVTRDISANDILWDFFRAHPRPDDMPGMNPR